MFTPCLTRLTDVLEDAKVERSFYIKMTAIDFTGNSQLAIFHAASESALQLIQVSAQTSVLPGINFG
jgi:hypothetical protein